LKRAIDIPGQGHTHKALALNPDGIDPNYFYADFLVKEGE
jgi:hypothetical protein